jgi:hypothetical protein
LEGGVGKPAERQGARLLPYAFRSELTVTKKHTRNGRVRYEGEIARAITTLAAFQQHEARRVVVLQECALTDQAAEALMLRSFESGLISHLTLPKVIREWRRPSCPEFAPRTAWSMFNAFTTVLGPRAESNPQEHARLTMSVGALVDAAAGIKAYAESAPAAESGEPTTAA